MADEFLLDTDIFRNLNRGEFVSLVSGNKCFTTVIQASELLFSAADEEESAYFGELLGKLSVLGIHQKYAKKCDELAKFCVNSRDALVCSAAIYNKLAVLTTEPERYNKFKKQPFSMEK